MDGGGLIWLLLAVGAAALLGGTVMLTLARGRRSGRPVRVVGVGGGGANAVEAMIRARMKGIEYVVVNTDSRDLRRSSAGTKVAIGKSLTNGSGAGGDPAIGEAAAREGADEIAQAMAGSELVVIMAGLGRGTGSGAAPVVAEVARQQGALTIAVVTRPFAFEGYRRGHVAEAAAMALTKKVDAVATVPNDHVREIMPGDVTVDDAFRTIDEALRRSVGEILDLVSVQGRISLDFADVRAVLRGGGAAALGFGRATGENRATEAARKAIAGTPLQAGVKGPVSLLVNVTGSQKLRLSELDAVAATVLASAGQDANLVFGMSTDRRLRDEVQVTLIATGFDGSRPEATNSASADGSPAWRPVWLRRTVDEEELDQEAATSRRSRRARAKAERAQREPDNAPDQEAMPDDRAEPATVAAEPHPDSPQGQSE